MATQHTNPQEQHHMLLRDLATNSDTTKPDAISALVAKANGKPNGQLNSVRLEIQGLEAKHQMSTSEMKTRFAAGKIVENYEIVRWLMLARMVRG